VSPQPFTISAAKEVQDDLASEEKARTTKRYNPLLAGLLTIAGLLLLVFLV
jgi:hypothetical protein